MTTPSTVTLYMLKNLDDCTVLFAWEAHKAAAGIIELGLL